MSVEKSFAVNLKLKVSEYGDFESVRILKGRSALDENILERINRALAGSLVPATIAMTPVEIGNIAEQKVLQHLLSISKVNQDFQVIDTSAQTGHGDLCVITKNKTICIEVKDYRTPLPMAQIAKYHNSLALGEYDAGIIIQMDDIGYAREAAIRSPIDLRIVDGKPSTYFTGIQLDMIYPIINFMVMNCSLSSTIDQSELENKRKALLTIYERVLDLRSLIEQQKKSIIKMEAAIESIAKLSMA